MKKSNKALLIMAVFMVVVLLLSTYLFSGCKAREKKAGFLEPIQASPIVLIRHILVLEMVW